MILKTNSLGRRGNIVAFIVVLSMLIIALFIAESKKVPNCERALEAYRKLSFNGIVIKKFIDYENHRYATMIVLQESEETYFTKYRDISGFYEYAEVNDSVVKVSGSLNIKLFRDTNEVSFTLDFNCDEID